MAPKVLGTYVPTVPPDPVPPAGTRPASPQGRATRPGVAPPANPPLNDAFGDDEEDSALRAADSLASELGVKNRRIRELEKQLEEVAVPSGVEKSEPAPDAERAVGRLVLLVLKRYGLGGIAILIAGGVALRPAAAPQRVDGQAERISELEHKFEALNKARREERASNQAFRDDTVGWLQLHSKQLGIEARTDPDATAPTEIKLEAVQMADPTKPRSGPIWRSNRYLPRTR